MQKVKLKPIDFVSVFFRTFFLQAVWNFKSLVSVGVSFALVPVAKRLSSNRAECAAILKRHLYFFNAHPYFASFALGALARLEEERANGHIQDSAQIEKFRNALIGPLGAVGDLYFWATIKPAAILAGVAGVLIAPTPELKLAAIFTMLVLYNIPHFHIRVMGLWKGYKNGYNIYKCLKIEEFAKVKSIYQILGALLLGAVIATVFINSGTNDFRGALVFILAVLGTGFMRYKGKLMHISILVALGLALVIGTL